MELLQNVLDSIAAERKPGRRVHPAVMTHVVLGYPTLPKSLDIVRAMADAGARIIELQIPFSDPIADGPTIMAANEAALKSGIKVRDSFRAAEKLARELSTPLLFMSYFNILYRYSRVNRKISEQRVKGNEAKKSAATEGGVRAFCRDAAGAGVQGLIVPDVPPEEDEAYWKIARAHKLSAIPIVTPVSTDHRLRLIRSVARDGFIYCVTTTGTTGARKSLPKEIPAYLRRMRGRFSQPLAAGFGISSRAQVAALAGSAEIAIVGSAVIDKIQSSTPQQMLRNVSAFVGSLT